MEEDGSEVAADADRREERTVAKGVTAWMRSPRGANCICCDGLHVFCYFLADEQGESIDYNTAVYREIVTAPEGATVRIIVEVTGP